MTQTQMEEALDELAERLDALAARLNAVERQAEATHDKASNTDYSLDMLRRDVERLESECRHRY